MPNDVSIRAEFKDTSVTLVSRYPLLGTLELASSNGAIELLLDRGSAEALISSVALFLLQDGATPTEPPSIGDFSL